MECAEQDAEQDDIDIVPSDFAPLQRRMDSCQPAFKDKQQARRGSIHIENTAKPPTGSRKTPTAVAQGGQGVRAPAATSPASNKRRGSHDSATCKDAV